MKVYFLFLLRCRKLENKEPEMANAEELTDRLCQLLQMFGMEVNSDVLNEFIDSLNYVRERGEREIQTFYRTVFISKVSSCMPSTFEISLKETLETLENPLIRIIANFVENGDIPTLNDIKKLGQQGLPCLIVHTIGNRVGLKEGRKSSLQATCKYMLNVAEGAGFSKGDIMKIVSLGIARHLLPNAPEHVREKIVKSLKQGSEMLLSHADRKPSIESFFGSLWEISGERFFIDGFKAKADEIIGKMPLATDKLNVFVTKYVGGLLAHYCRDRERDLLLSFVCLSIENIVKKGTLQGREFIGRGIEILYQSLRRTLEKQSMDDISKLGESIYELLRMLYKEIKEDAKKELIALVDNVRGVAANELSSFYKTVMIPKLSQYIKAGSGIPVEVLFKVTEKPVTSILENFVKKCEIPTLDNIKRIGKEAFSRVVIDTVGDKLGLREETKSSLQVTCNYMLNVAEKTGISKGDTLKIVSFGIAQHLLPNAPESVRDTIVQSLQQGSRILFGSAEKKPSIEIFFRSLWELSGERFFIDGFKAKADEIIGKMPDSVDKVAEFVMKHVMPLLTTYCNKNLFGVIWPFTRLTIDVITKKGTIRGRDFITPGGEIIIRSLAAIVRNKQATSAATGTTVRTLHKEVTETVMEKITEKVVVKKTGEVVTAKVSKEVTASASKRMAKELTEHAVASNGMKELIKKSSSKGTERIAINTAKKASCQFAKKQVAGSQSQQIMMKVGTKTTNKIAHQVGDQSMKITSKVAQGAEKTAKVVTRSSNKVLVTASKEITIENSVKVVGDVTTVTAEKTTVNFFEKTTKQKIVQETTENVAKAGAKTALKECCKAAAISSLVGGVFLYKDLRELEEDYKNGRITAEEYQKQRTGRYGEFVGDVIGSGFAGAVTSAAALSGPAGLAMIGAGALVSYVFGRAGRQIANSVS